jgi:ABC-type nitrate/sulfonate/bicarbonate transport system substrate-binding protein
MHRFPHAGARALAATSILAAAATLMIGCAGADPSPPAGTGGSVEDQQISFILGPGNTAPFFNLENQGFAADIYADNGLVPTFSTGANGNELTAALLGGSSDFAHVVSASAIGAVNQGECLSFLTANNVPYTNFIGLPGIELEHEGEEYPDNVLDLEGKTIGLTSLGGAQEAVTNKILADAGLSAADVTYVAVGAPQTGVTALQEGQIDVLFAQPPSEQLLGGEGEFVSVVPLFEIPEAGVSYVQSLFATTCDYAEQNPEVVQAFCRAQQETRSYVLDPANRDEMVAAIEETLGLSNELAVAAWDGYATHLWPANVSISEDDWEGQQLWIGESPLPAYDENVNAACQEAVAEVAPAS